VNNERKMRGRRKRVRRRDGSVYVMKTKRDVWKSRRVGANRRIQPSMDWTAPQQTVWQKETVGKKGKAEKRR
jgi:hypothetical protein